MTMRVSTMIAAAAFVAGSLVCAPRLSAQEPAKGAKGDKARAPAAAPAPVSVPSDYTIGADDALSIVYWKEPDMSADVVVRPDGKISLPLINEVVVLGLTPEQLRAQVTEAAKKFVEDPNVTVVVRQVNSRKVFITGNVERPGPYPLTGPTTVLHLIATAGGLREFADPKNILIMRVENNKSTALPFNYEELSRGKNLQQNIVLRPGDTVLVP